MIFENALNKHNPNDKRSHSVLRFFSEDLTEDEKIDFVKSIFNRGAWTLSTSISRSSFESVKLRDETKNTFKGILQKWVNKRVDHSNEKLTADTKNPYLPKKYSYEFREAIFAIKDLDFHPSLMVFIENFISGCFISYLDKFINSSFWVIIDEFSTNELETFFKYFSNLYTKYESENIGYFLYVFLRNLAYSSKIFLLSEDFIRNLNGLSLKLKASDNHKDYSLLISILLIDFIKFKKLDLVETKYVSIILPTIDNLERGNLDNLELLVFLNKFNYRFTNYNFKEEIYSLLYSIEVNISIVDDGEEISKKAILHHFIKSSEKYLEFLVFHLKFIEKVDRIYELERFISLIDRLRVSFTEVMWFKEYDEFLPIKGIISKALPDGFGVELDSKYVTEYLNRQTLPHLRKEEFIVDNSFGFSHKRTFKKNSDVNEYHSHLELNQESSSYYSPSPDSVSKINIFQIWNVNYSSSNKGSVINLMPFNESIYYLINRFKIKCFFSCVDLLLANEAFRLLDEVSPFGTRQYSPVLGRLLPSILKPSVHLEFDINSFWETLKNYRPNLYNETFTKTKRDIRLFQELVNIHDKEEIVQGTIKSRTKGGFFVDIKGQKAFLPGSQIENYTINDYDSYVDTNMPFKIIKIDYVYKSVIVSHLIINEEKIKKQRQRIISNLAKGVRLSGTVKNVTSFGAFIDLGGIDGLIYIKNLSWLKINHPKEIVDVGEKIDVIVIDFDLKNKKIDLGLKQLQPHPWDGIESKIFKGKLIKGKIVKLIIAGAIIEILPGVEGLAHKSDIARALYSSMKVGKIVTAKVIRIDYFRKVIRFSLAIEKDLSRQSFLKFIEKVRVGDILEGFVLKINKGTGFVRIKDNKSIIAICPARFMRSSRAAFSKHNNKFKLLEIDEAKTLLIVSHFADK